jgi:anti-sigma regulatory factor (Ser/Thr protein kinase)
VKGRTGDGIELRTTATEFWCRLDGNPFHVRRARRAAIQWASGTGLSMERVDDVALAVNEALTNSVQHAYPGARGPVWLDGHVAVGQVRMVVTDHGHWRPSGGRHHHGRGLRLVHALADHAHLERGDDATTITMVWNLTDFRLWSDN